MKQRTIAFSAATILLALACATGGHAEDATSYPSQQIRIVVPFPAGGTADTLPRIVSRPMLSGKLTTLVPQLIELLLDV